MKMLQFPGLNRHCNIYHFITTRYGGVSQGAYHSMNLGEYCGDDIEDVSSNRVLLSDYWGISANRLFTPYQIHGAEIGILNDRFVHLPKEKQSDFLYGIDALITNERAVCIAVSTADCVPVIVYAPDKKVSAVIHAGWRGTVQYIVVKTIQKMIDVFQCDPSQMYAGIGPSISKDAFEVGEEVADVFRQTFTDVSDILFYDQKTGKAHLDLWETNRLQLISSGLLSDHIDVSGICTYLQCDEFFSARRLGIHSGRMLSGIIINE